MADVTPIAELMQRMFTQNRALARQKDAFVGRQLPDPGDGRQIEFYPPWETESPQPGKVVLEMYNGAASPQEQQTLLTGDALHYLGAVDPRNGQTVDPTFRRLKTEVLGTMTPQQMQVNRDAYARQAPLYDGNPPPLDQWMDMSRGDEFLMGYLTPDRADQWRNFYTPQQRQMLEQMRTYLQRGSLAPGMTR